MEKKIEKIERLLKKKHKTVNCVGDESLSDPRISVAECIMHQLSIIGFSILTTANNLCCGVDFVRGLRAVARCSPSCSRVEESFLTPCARGLSTGSTTCPGSIR